MWLCHDIYGREQKVGADSRPRRPRLQGHISTDRSSGSYMLTWSQESGLAVHLGPTQKPQPRPEVGADSSGSFRAIGCMQSSPRAALTDGQLAANLSGWRLQRAKANRKLAKFQLTSKLQKLPSDRPDFLLSAGAAGPTAKISPPRRCAICSSKHLPTVQIPQRPGAPQPSSPLFSLHSRFVPHERLLA